MSQDHRFRTGLRSAKASRKLRIKRRLRDGRSLLIEQLEQRSLLAGLVDVSESLLSGLPAYGAEGEASSSSTSGRLDVGSSAYRYVPPRHIQSKFGDFLTGPASGTPLQIARNYLHAHAAELGLTDEDVDHLVVKDQVVNPSTGATSIYFKQTYNNLEITNADVSVNVAGDGKIINVGSTAIGNLSYSNPPATLSPAVSTLDAFKQFGKDFGLTFKTTPTIISAPQGFNQRAILSGGGVTADNVATELQYVATPSGLELSWKMVVPTADRAHIYDTYQSANTGGLVLVSDWIANAAYDVFPIPTESPDEGGRQIVVDPQDPIASPFGWHDVNGRAGPEFLDTRGNNVFAQEDRLGLAGLGGNQIPGNRPTGGPNLNFDFPINLSQTPSTYTNASVVNLFYLANVAHDVFYKYGFDELSGNFQSLNYSGLGIGGDPVIALAQSGGASALLGPRMSFPPDGISPTLIMTEFNQDISALFNPTIPLYNLPRDSAFVANIVIHEFGHGVNNRLAGGPQNSNSLFAIQSDAMDEGTSDFYGFWFTQRPTDLITDRYPQGDYLAGPAPTFPGKGVRHFPYSFDLTVNPLTFGNFNGIGGATCLTPASNCESHNAGEIWAQTLIDLNWVMINKYGYSSDIHNGQAGNNLAMRLVIDALKLIPVSPTFLNFRDAILQADLMANRGVNHKEIWTAFARRGMGFSADSDITNPGTTGDNPNSIQVRESFDFPTNPGFIRGKVFADTNGNGVLDATETGIGGVTVFLDIDNDGVFEPLEPTTQTAADGTYEFELFVSGNFSVRQLLPAGLQQTSPAGTGGLAVTLINGQTVANVNFGVRAGNALTTGIVFNDLDADGRRDEDEPGLPGVSIYADYDGDKRMDLGEPQTTTDQNGNYTLKLDRPGTFFVRQVIPAGFAQTFPTRNDGFQVTIVTGALNANFEFGDTAAEDWGDAPNSYGTLASSNGPVHGLLPGFFLGNSVDLESDGRPSATADGDDIVPTGVDDEDGVQFTSTMFPGSTTTLTVSVNLKDRITATVNGKLKTTILQDNSAGRLHAWVDFNRNGVFDDPGEKVFDDVLLFEGTHNLSLNVPRSATPGVSFARFRYTYEHKLSPTGRAIAGEVEDYQVRILTDTPDAVDDVFTVDQNTVANTLNVLANDIPSSSGPLTILSFTPSARGATIVISPDGQSLRYTPQRGSIGSDSFTYTVRDPAGTTDTARVSVTILPSFSQPIAVDDSVDVNENSTNNEINVLANDLPGRFPPIGIVFPGSPANGIVDVDNRGTTNPADDVLVYTPNSGFAGTDQFQYTIEDASFQQSTATVTVHVLPGDLDDDIVLYKLQVTDINNRAIQAIGVGETFKIRAFVRDLRPDDTVPDSPVERDNRGVGAAYFDALYPFSLVSLQGALQFTGPYTNATSGNINTPGLINEAGALQTGSTPLGAGELLLWEVLATATGVGTAQFIGDPADQTSENPGSPDHDTVLFEPPQNAVLARQLRFQNTSLQVVGTGGRPVATDNTFIIPANSLNFPLNVLANDVEVNNPPLRISAVGSPTSTSFTTPNGSRVSISPDGQLLLYSPRTGFNGTEQFTYTVSNAVNLTSSAVVTVQVGAPTKDVSIRLEATDLQGNPLTGPVLVGDDFLLRVLVQDVRANPPDPTRMGIFASYLDLLYDGNLVSTIGDINTAFGFRIQFGPEYNANGQSASNDLPNLINELGAFQTSFGPLGPNEFLLAAVTFNADKTGTANFVSDPADLSPLHDVLLFEPDDSAVPLSRINFRTTSVVIIGNGEGEAVFHNSSRPADVNNDGIISPMDALLVINDLNINGARYLYKTAAGEGEFGNKKMLDVNGDRWATPIDALQAINAVAKKGTAEGEFTRSLLEMPEEKTDTLLFVSPSSQLATRDLSIAPRAMSRRNELMVSQLVSILPLDMQCKTTQIRDDLFAEFDFSAGKEIAVEDLLPEHASNEWWLN